MRQRELYRPPQASGCAVMRGLMVLCGGHHLRAGGCSCIVYVLAKGLPNICLGAPEHRAQLSGRHHRHPAGHPQHRLHRAGHAGDRAAAGCGRGRLPDGVRRGNQKLVAVIEYAAETLSGIPSIIYGLVGMLFFCQFLGMKTSLLAGALTLVIMNLPTIMRTTQESLKTVPQSYREGAFGLGAGKWRVIRTVVLPGCVDGVITGCILAVGRILGEIGGASLHRGLRPRALRQSVRSAAQRRRYADRGTVRLRQGAGRVRRGLRHRRHPDGADAAHQPGGRA